MAHKCFISFKAEDKYYKNYIQNELNIDMIDKSLDEAIDSEDFDYVMRKIREDYLAKSTVTIFLIGQNCSENLGILEQAYIKREIQASLYHRSGNTQNGILGIVLPSMYSDIYKGYGTCSKCGNSHNYVNINNSTVIKEFSYNYYIPHNKCAWSEDDRYCILVKWNDFIVNPEDFIDRSYDKRTSIISEKTRVRP